MAENEVNTGYRQRFTDRLRTKYPDRKFEDDEEIFNVIYDDYDRFDHDYEELESRRANDDKLLEAMERNPKAAQFISDMVAGDDPWLNLIKRVGLDGISDMLNDPDKAEAYKEAHKEYLDRVAKSREFDKQYDENIVVSRAAVNDFQAKHSLSDEQVERICDLLDETAHDVILGKITEQHLTMAMKALNYDTDIANASQEAEVRGRNMAVEAKLRKPNKSDGVPHLDGTNNITPQNIRAKNIFELAAEAK